MLANAQFPTEPAIKATNNVICSSEKAYPVFIMRTIDSVFPCFSCLVHDEKERCFFTRNCTTSEAESTTTCRAMEIPPLLFVHGWCINKSYWESQMKYFRDKYTVVAMDLPGHGAVR
jgi:pimeloyl-ACP methyl ester carboxylesterase